MKNENTGNRTLIKDFGYKANYIEKYYKFPSFLISDPNYSQMSDSAKITYMLFKNEFSRALDEKWIDEDGMLYLEFTQKKLMKLLNCYQGKVKKIISELSDNGLIEKAQREPRATTEKHKKNRYYLLQPVISTDDLFIQNELSEQINPLDNDKFSTEIKTVLSGDAKIEQEYFINKSLDTDRQIIDSTELESTLHQSGIMLENFVSYMCDRQYSTFVPKRVLSLIQSFSKDIDEAEETVRTIQNAKRKAEELVGRSVVFEELIGADGVSAEQKLYLTLMRAYRKKKSVKVANMQNVIFVFVRNLFQEELIPASDLDRTEIPKVITKDWLHDE